MPTRTRPRFRLRTLLILLTVCCVAGGLLASRMADKRREERLAGKIIARGGTVCYDYQWSVGASSVDETAAPYGPSWARSLVGETFFSNIVFVSCAAARDEDLEEIGRLRSLKLLGLSGASEVTDQGLQHLGRLHALEELYLADTPIGDRGLAALPGLGNLQLLALDSTAVTDQGMRSIRHLRLSNLSLRGVPITDKGTAQLAGHRYLQDLDLAGTNITPASLEELARLPRLVSLTLPAGREIAETELEEFRKQRPDVAVTVASWSNGTPQ